MKRVPLIMAVGALLLVLSAGVALVHLDHIRCVDENPGSDLCRGTDESDHIIGSGSESDPDEEPGPDDIYADNQDKMVAATPMLSRDVGTTTSSEAKRITTKLVAVKTTTLCLAAAGAIR